MTLLQNRRHELFAQAIVKGKAVGEAYVEAGYKPSPSSPSRLLDDDRIKQRIQELLGRQGTNVVLTRQYVIEALIENAEKALGRKPVKIGSNGHARETFVYRGDVANQAIRLAGLEFGLFVERKEIKHTSDLAKLSDTELLEVLVKEAEEAQVLLEYHGGEDEPLANATDTEES